MAILREWEKCLLDLFFPRLCVGCGRAGAWYCQDCMVRLREGAVWERLELDGGLAVRGAFSFNLKLVREGLHYLKYNGVGELAAALVGAALINDKAGVISEWLWGHGAEPVLLPVPVTERKLKQRGYNQAELIARALGDGLGVEVQTQVLRRVKQAASQVGLSGEARKAESRGNFVCTLVLDDLAGRQPVLVDDVCTTGSTLLACAEALTAAGGQTIKALVLALA